MSQILECPHKKEDSLCAVHPDLPSHFPEICHGPTKCFGANAKKHLEAIQPTDECLHGVVKSKVFKDRSCGNCEDRKSKGCRWLDQEKPEKKAKSKKEKAQPTSTLFNYMVVKKNASN